MSIRLGLLALLAERPKYGAQLRTEFESRTGGAWPLNVGQVYTTLGRLERDGLVRNLGGDDDSHIAYELTDEGRAVTAAWWASPVGRVETPRNELVIKLALAVTSPGVDVTAVVQTQRTATMRHLRDLTRLKATPGSHPRGVRLPPTSPERDLAWSLVLENLLFGAEAEARWLDHVEATLVRTGAASAAPPDTHTDHSERPAPPARGAGRTT
ncbi:PadR family transcriptional regulator [Lapillicoccus sp.]|uniref:PadR family transcriptional regulator n=1 Tax=Lapillicoccus sp. TaxID=1909287 RepID=UPI0032631088